jgi:hypothetical protein
MPVRLAAASDGPGLTTTGQVVGYDQNHPSRRRRLVIAHAHDKNMPPSMYEYFRGAVWQRRKYHDLAAKTYVEPEIADLSALIRQQCDLIEERACGRARHLLTSGASGLAASAMMCVPKTS